MYAFRLKLGTGTHTNDEVIYHDIRFVGGISTTICSEREEEFFRACGMQVGRVPVESPEYNDLRAEGIKSRTEYALKVSNLDDLYQEREHELIRQLNVATAERDEARKQLALNLELMELRKGKKDGTNAKVA